MNLCSSGHDEVCYEGRNCPVCEMEKDKDKDIEKLDEAIDELRDRLETAEEEIGSMRVRLAELENKEDGQ